MMTVVKNTQYMNTLFFSIKEVSIILSVAYLTVYRWIKSGKLKAVKSGKQYRINRKDIDEFLHIQK